ncbi:hypothetical protein KXW98_005381 [Aspergillus fumigatus]|nr:hypothetical protein CNMCM8057_002975 [Aspergillus fumigatus]KAF4284520.1 hypothetical protein CNMCM8689_006104 [Aspergillus fumigatus]KAH1275801.1 hypothetical protein KXX45_005833 [Aspergillus fumigatus]KAH1288132.1 hypothetical protein KXX30_007900 [Aspergillus fumigatus]KAH1316891.1 hypothetical protein KXX47_002947 [Aspergillus fumigatus]
MVFALDTATEADAPRIADIHMAAFHTNGMLLAQFPTPAVRKGLWTSLVDKVVKEIRDPQWEVLVAREADDRVVSFAKWCLPLSESTVYEEEPWVWPEGTNMAILNGWAKKVEQAAKEIMGKTPCYRLSFIATDPSYALRGAGSLLVNWGIERSKEENIPIALESTLDAVPFYQRLGFQTEARISMPLEGIGKDESILPLLPEQLVNLSHARDLVISEIIVDVETRNCALCDNPENVQRVFGEAVVRMIVKTRCFAKKLRRHKVLAEMPWNVVMVWENGNQVISSLKNGTAHIQVSPRRRHRAWLHPQHKRAPQRAVPPQVQVPYGRLEMNTIPGFEQFGLNDQEEYTGHTFLSHTLPGRERLAQLLDQS